MNNNIKLIIAGSAVVIIALILVVFITPKNSVQQPSPQSSIKPSLSPISPTPIPTPLPSLSSKITSKKELLKLLPIQTVGFNIEYLKNDDTILVTIKEKPIDQNQKSSEDWFIAAGVTDFKKYNIQWVIAPELKDKPLFNQ